MECLGLVVGGRVEGNVRLRVKTGEPWGTLVDQHGK